VFRFQQRNNTGMLQVWKEKGEYRTKLSALIAKQTVDSAEKAMATLKNQPLEKLNTPEMLEFAKNLMALAQKAEDEKNGETN